MSTSLFDFFQQNPLVFAAFLIWSLFWKGLALWRAGHLGQKYWFIILLVVNTAGLLEIIYLFYFSKKKIKMAIDANQLNNH
ncbi:MAG: hypothetical protein UU87_C0002G0013 [Parcubacteria group bacterium GW2011_GWA2_42_11]|nr:MAG: hypothetical protein UU87_C0002G0013 [Parcubacteria group bacterium GW2011_GWA2_42_11]